MIDHAVLKMGLGAGIAAERIRGVNDNMSVSHYHPFYELYFLEAGQRYHLLNDQLYSVDAGQFLLFEPFVLHHSYGADNVPFCRLLLYFEEDQILSGELKKMLHGSSGAYEIPEKETHQFHQLMNMIHAELQNPQDFSQEYCQSLLNTMLVILFRNKRLKSRHEQKTMITEVISYINSNYMKPLTLEEIANRFYISTFHLCREFKHYTNTTVIQYLNKTRILNAQQMLFSTGKSITEISMDTGFASSSHFGRIFKEVTGCTPSKWRRQGHNF